MALSKSLLAQTILTNINNISIDVPHNTTKSDGTVDASTSSTTIGASASPAAAKLNQDMAKAIANAVIDHITQFMEISNGIFTLTNGTISGPWVGSGGGPAPVAVPGGPVASETGTVNIPPGAIK